MTIERLNMVVGIATAGRREILSRALDLLANQSRPPDRLLISRMTSSDVDEAALERFPASTLVLDGATGLTAQRNKILSAAKDADIVVFFDDDFFVCDSYLANLETLFLAHSNIVAATGRVLADGASGPGLSAEEGLRILSSRSSRESDGDQFSECYGTYGCNMAFRAAPIRLNNILFDENLPFYGWQEDIDFSRQLARHGLIVKANNLQGVHLGSKLGRTSGVRFGYSQIANPVYLIRKGTISWKRAANLMWRNIAANLVHSLSPEPWIDRRGRLKGNVLAAVDLVLGRSSPRRILQLS
jgi:succinoglycan biosynthesis transport protein ExoP